MQAPTESSPATPPSSTAEADGGEPYLCFQLVGQQVFALPANAIREVLLQPVEAITPMPNTSPVVLGTLNLRGQVVWVADLGLLLDSGRPLQLDRAEIPVLALEVSDVRLGLAVDRLGDMIWITQNQIRKPTLGADSQQAMMRGQWWDTTHEQWLLLLDPSAILAVARWLN
jgi:purine-binding chemotaxis protein CheW